MSRIWLVTGSSRGLGREITRAALARGNRVVATARRPEDLAEFTETYGDAVRATSLDVTDPAAARAAVELAVREFGGLDVVVNNAGYANSAAFEETPEDDFRAQVETNLFGVVNVTRAALPVLRGQRSGHIVQISSVGGRVGGSPGLSAYQTAKFGVAGFSEVLINELAPLGVKVTVVEPGGFRTDWAGPSMRIAEPGPDYAETLRMMTDYREQRAGREPGDPARAGQVIADLIEHPDPPRRLLLGSDALTVTVTANERQMAEAQAWAQVSRSTDFPA
ncbi:oxidoreductase [Crossiella cryophila]|uniref:NAD(P)-dependent dehydrogenase (Short-subunit alcohol dehydrogenase family) n=1 Tax=Crossiella cryophila TaxID=43355 RepID=A0A7W7FRG3_9PSEU|nr:oxidoreductase [Crossiella cryophila]MBB4675142.1 NAD(P)-dependent dehydrogenase (short-subunit alcohol dehydrogenase family) [Crossiella cryophila]